MLAQTGDLPQPLRSLVESELAFSDASLAGGMRSAFLEYLAPDGVLFRPTPVPGRKWFEEQPPVPGRLTWRPEFADVSSSGDMGYTTGPYEFAAEDESRYGQFVTVWRRSTGGRWRVAIDHGIAHAAPDKGERGVRFPVQAHSTAKPAIVDKEVARGELIKNDLAFSEASAEEGFLRAFLSFAADDVRVYRAKHFPVTGKSRAQEIVSEEPPHPTWKPTGGDVSGSGDLGYTYGLIEKGGKSSNSYLRIWRNRPEDGWRVVVDLSNPLP